METKQQNGTRRKNGRGKKTNGRGRFNKKNSRPINVDSGGRNKNSRPTKVSGGGGTTGGSKSCLQKTIAYNTCLDRLSSGGGGYSYDTIVHTKLPPYTARNERLVSDTIYLSLLQDDTPMNCNTIKQMEEYTLSYLADNIGGSGFQPACVQVMDAAHDASKVQQVYNYKDMHKNVFNDGKQKKKDKGKRDETIESTTLILLVTYVEKLGHQKSLRSSGQYTTLEKARCCSQNAINHKPGSANLGQFCTLLGCNVHNCGGGRQRGRGNFFTRKLKNELSVDVHEYEGMSQRKLPKNVVLPFTLKKMDYTVELSQSTDFTPDASWAELGVDNVDDVAKCSTNRYSLETVRILLLLYASIQCTIQ